MDCEINRVGRCGKIDCLKKKMLASFLLGNPVEFCLKLKEMKF